MCNRTDCAGVFMGELACRVCEEGEMRKLSRCMRRALEDLANPCLVASAYFQQPTLQALERRGLAVRSFGRWRVTDEGEKALEQREHADATN